MLILCILVVGCTSQPSAPAPVQNPQTSMPTTISTPIQTEIPTQNPVVTAETQATDPILHRYVKLNKDLSGYEFTFYPGGVVSYRAGSTKQVKGDYTINVVDNQASGTWTSLGNNKYLVQFLPVGVEGAKIIREYTLVPAHKDPEYGAMVPEYIMSTYESENLNKAERIQINQMYRYYPQRFAD